MGKDCITLGAYDGHPLYLVKTDYGICLCDQNPPTMNSKHYSNYFLKKGNYEFSPVGDELPLLWGIDYVYKKNLVKVLDTNDQDIEAVTASLNISSLTGTEIVMLTDLKQRLLNDCWEKVMAFADKFEPNRASITKMEMDKFNGFKEELAACRDQQEVIYKKTEKLNRIIKNWEEEWEHKETILMSEDD